MTLDTTTCSSSEGSSNETACVVCACVFLWVRVYDARVVRMYARIEVYARAYVSYVCIWCVCVCREGEKCVIQVNKFWTKNTHNTLWIHQTCKSKRKWDIHTKIPAYIISKLNYVWGALKGPVVGWKIMVAFAVLVRRGVDGGRGIVSWFWAVACGNFVTNSFEAAWTHTFKLELAHEARFCAVRCTVFTVYFAT